MLKRLGFHVMMANSGKSLDAITYSFTSTTDPQYTRKIIFTKSHPDDLEFCPSLYPISLPAIHPIPNPSLTPHP
jgi:hypothetical protein